MGYFANLTSAAKAWGLALDRLEGAILGAPAGQTISMWAAQSAQAGSRFAKATCFLLSILVQCQHCQKTLSNQPMGWLSYIRAFALLIGIPLLLIFCITKFLL